MNYVVVENHSMQYIVTEGDVISVEKLDKNVGDKVVFDKVLLSVVDGTPTVGYPVCNIVVEGKVLDQKKDHKKIGMKYKSAGYRKKWGHRQQLTVIEITKIGSAKKEK